jgi:hypothetical protein
VDGDDIVLYSAPLTNLRWHVDLNKNVLKPRSGLVIFEDKDGEEARQSAMLIGTFEKVSIQAIPVDQSPNWQPAGKFRDECIKWSSAVEGNIIVQGTDYGNPNMQMLEMLFNTRTINDGRGIPWLHSTGATIVARCGQQWIRRHGAVEAALVALAGEADDHLCLRRSRLAMLEDGDDH